MPTHAAAHDAPADDRQAEDLAETLRTLKDRLTRGVTVTPVCLAILGWLCGTPTDPAVAELQRSAEGRVWLRLTDEARMEPLCSFSEFLAQVRIIAASLSLTDPQTHALEIWTRQRLG